MNLLNSLIALVQILDTPIYRRRLAGDNMLKEAMTSAKRQVDIANHDPIVVFKIKTGTPLPKFNSAIAVAYNDDDGMIFIFGPPAAALNHEIREDAFRPTETDGVEKYLW